MGSSNKTYQTLWVALGSLSSMALSIISAAILSRYFSKEEYGTYKQVIYIYNTLLMVFSAGLPKVFSYFLPRYSINEGKSIIAKVNKFLFLFGLLLSLFLYFFADQLGELLNNDGLPSMLRIFALVPALMLPTLGIEGVFSSYNKTIYIALYNSISRFVMLLCIVLPVILIESKIEYAIYGWVVASIFTFLLSLKFKSIPFKSVNNIFSDIKISEILKYSLPLMLASIWGIAIKAADQFYISRYFGTEVFAEYSNGFIELPFVSMITASISVVLMPMFSKQFHERADIGGLIETWRNVLAKSAYIIYPMVIFSMLFSSDIMTLLYTDAYSDSGIYFSINMFLNFFNIVMFAPLFLSMGKTKLYANVHLAIAICVWLFTYVVVIYFNSPVAVAISSTTFQIIKILIFMFLASKLLKVSFTRFFPIGQLSKLIVHNLTIAVIIRFIDHSLFNLTNNFLDLLLKGLFFASLTILTGPLIGLKYHEMLKPLVVKIKKRII